MLAAKVEKHPGVDLVMGNSHWEKTATLDFDKKQIPEFSDNPTWIRKSILKRFYLPVQAWNKLVRKDLIRNERIYFEGGCSMKMTCGISSLPDMCEALPLRKW